MRLRHKKKNNASNSYLQQKNKNDNAALTNNGSIPELDISNPAESLLAAEKPSLGMSYLTALASPETSSVKKLDLTKQFSDVKLVQLTADDLPLKDYLHHVLGDLLGVSYVLGEQVKADDKAISLNLQQDISQQKLFTISEQLLTERGYVIRFEDNIYYIHKSEGSGPQGDIVYGYGQNIDSVPNTSSTIVQLVPFVFGMQTSLANTLKQLVTIKATPDFQRSTLILEGKRKNIIKALEFIALMDQPLFKNRQIGVYKGIYVSTDELIKQLPDLLKQDGISVSAVGQNDLAVSIVPLDRIGTLVLFANNKKLLERVGFWAKQIDQAPSGNQLQYFLYSPQFARATDLGESLQLLIGGANSGAGSGNSQLGGSTSAAAQNSSTSANKSQANGAKSISASNEDMTLVVDERSNALIFNTTGDKYRQLLPLIKRLDVMPKQVLLEMMIAEVKLTDEFQQGVSFALTNLGANNITGGFNLASGAAGLTYALRGAQGSLTVNLLETNALVNVLSRPSLLVRDGVVANITVGDDIPTVGEIVTDPVNGSKSSIVYRKTGVELTVKPTINARGVVSMEIDQKISNTATGGSSVEGTPTVFERSIKTEVIAESGQTIILGGLISETSSNTDTRVPFFSSIPFIGSLFNTAKDSSDKTELVVLVTPRVIESGDEWNDIKAKFALELNNIIINQ